MDHAYWANLARSNFFVVRRMFHFRFHFQHWHTCCAIIVPLLLYIRWTSPTPPISIVKREISAGRKTRRKEVRGGTDSVARNSRLLTHYLGRHSGWWISGWRGEVPTQGLPGENSGMWGEGVVIMEHDMDTHLQQGNVRRIPRICPFHMYYDFDLRWDLRGA
jgi:hypothetical protein